MALDCSGYARRLLHRHQSYGRFGTAFAETDLDRANYETIIADLMSGQHDDPLRVMMFNPKLIVPRMSRTRWEMRLLRRLGLEGRGAKVPVSLTN